MPRRRRVAVPGYPHHIVQRGHNRREVFVGDDDRDAYLETLREFREILGLKVYSYCLMSNHVHLIIDPGNDAHNLSRLMKRLAGRHTRRINRLERRTGTSWEGRFKCSPIQSDGYLLACARYIDLNPVRAGIVASPEEYPWSSYRTRVGLHHCEWLDMDPCFLALAATAEERQHRYRDFVASGIPERQLEFLRTAVRRNQLTGSDAFVVEIEQRIGECVLPRPPGRPFKQR